ARPSADGRRVEVVVEDTGEGIPEELLTRVFEPHFSTRTSGTGLGLAIVRRLVESWGGEISAESDPGSGTRRRIVLRAPDAERELRAVGGAKTVHPMDLRTEEGEMADLKRAEQRGEGDTGGISHPSGGDEGENNRGAEFGTSERATRGTDRDADRSG